MKTPYDRIAAQSLGRLAGLSDGIFAVAMTLLVLDLKVPISDALHQQTPLWIPGAIHSEGILWSALLQLLPRVVPYLMSFLTLGMFWVGQQTQLNYCARSDRNFTWLHLAFLSSVTLVPFSTALLTQFVGYRLALIIYWLNLVLMGSVLLLSWKYAERAKLLNEDVTHEIRSVISRRIVGYQAMYAGCVLLCVITTHISIVLILLLQLHSAVSPRRSPLRRL